jgi:hypothetical protein
MIFNRMIFRHIVSCRKGPFTKAEVEQCVIAKTTSSVVELRTSWYLSIAT